MKKLAVLLLLAGCATSRFDRLSPTIKADIEQPHLARMRARVEDGSYPLIIFDDYKMKRTEYSARAARRDPDYQKGLEWAREHLKKRLEKREYIDRGYNDFDEGPGNVMGIKDRYMAFLVKRYLDLFDDPKTWPKIERLFNGEEQGGLVLEREGAWSLLPMRNVLDDKEKYDIWPVQLYSRYIGEFHTHPSNGRPPEEYAGPSGQNMDFQGDVPFSDLLALRWKAIYLNPFTIDCVISEVGTRAYDVDIYFRDVQNINGKAVNDRLVTVIDLGVYRR